jgi:hypothetical protein
MARNFVDVFGNPGQFESFNIAVVATDSFLSGWGRASGLIHKQVIICDNYADAARVASNMKGNGYKYISIRCHGVFPTFPASRYSVSYRLASDCPLLLR